MQAKGGFEKNGDANGVVERKQKKLDVVKGEMIEMGPQYDPRTRRVDGSQRRENIVADGGIDFLGAALL